MKGIDDAFLSVRETSRVRSPLFLFSASSFLFLCLLILLFFRIESRLGLHLNMPTTKIMDADFWLVGLEKLPYVSHHD
jgi:hypothetical protein